MIAGIDRDLGNRPEGIGPSIERQYLARRIGDAHEARMPFVHVGRQGEPVGRVVAKQGGLALLRREVGQPCGQGLARRPHAGILRDLDAPSQHLLLGGGVQIAQQLPLPAVENAGPDRTDIGDGQQQQQAQALGRLHDLDEILDRLGIGEVALLGDVRHHQMVTHQPGDGLRIALAEAEPRA